MVIEPSSPENPQPPRQRLQKTAIVSGILLGLFVLVYCGLSACGAYAPGRWGLGKHGMEVRTWEWEPLLFYVPATGESRKWLEYSYLPLMIADRRLWHHDPDDDDPRHPAVFVFPKEPIKRQAAERAKSKAVPKPAP